MNTPLKKQPVGYISMAAAIYIAGIVLFSAWSYTMNRKALLGQFDTTLSNSVFTLREMMSDRIETCANVLSNTNSTAYLALQQKFERLCDHGGFEAISCTVHHHGKPYTLSTETPAINLNRMPPRRESNEKPVSLLTIGSSRIVILEEEEHLTGNRIRCIASRSLTASRRQLAQDAMAKIFSGLTLLVLAVPLVIVGKNAEKKLLHEAHLQNSRLRHDADLQHQYERELKEAIADLERFNNLTTGRELRIIELKGEVNTLLEQMNRPKRYSVNQTD